MNMRKEAGLKFAITLLFAAAVTSFTLPVLAAEVKVIANPGIKSDTISRAEIKRIFLLEESSLDDGTHVQPVLRKSGDSHETFLKGFLDTDDNALRAYYGTLLFSGRASMPKEFGSDREVVMYVAATKGAIGYVSGPSPTDGVKTLAIASSANRSQRTLIQRIEPEYPETLKRLGITGIVRLQVTISPRGNVENVQVIGGNPILAESVITAVKQWVYSSSRSRTTAEIDVPFDGRHPYP